MALHPGTTAALSIGGSVGAAVNVLQTLQVDPTVIEEIAKMLNKHHDIVMGGKPVGTQPTAFGQSSAGGFCGNHTSRAERKVVEAMIDMAEGLVGYRTTVKRFAKDTEDTDDRAKEDLQRITNQIVNARIQNPGGDQ